MIINNDSIIEEEDVYLKENEKCDILQKLNLININNGWNDNNEKIIISIGENCASYKWMHENCAVYHKCINILMNLLSIIFTSFLTAETFVKDDASDENIIIIRKTITYLLSVISLLQNFLNSEMLNSKHIHASNEFSKLYHDIQQQMCRFRRERKNATKYVSECLKHYDSLVINNPDINNFVLYKFKKIFGNNNVPSIEDRFNKIEIITEQTYQNKSKKGSSSDLGSGDLGSGDLGSGDLGSGGGENYTTFNVIKNVNNNLSNINNIYKINGDISDNDLKKIDSIELKRFNEHKLRYEYNRFLQHSDEND